MRPALSADRIVVFTYREQNLSIFPTVVLNDIRSRKKCMPTRLNRAELKLHLIGSMIYIVHRYDPIVAVVPPFYTRWGKSIAGSIDSLKSPQIGQTVVPSVISLQDEYTSKMEISKIDHEGETRRRKTCRLYFSGWGKGGWEIETRLRFWYGQLTSWVYPGSLRLNHQKFKGEFYKDCELILWGHQWRTKNHIPIN